MANKIITIGRQFGSGGRDIGEAIAKKLDIPFYDKKILEKASEDSGLCNELFENFDEKPTNSFLYSLVMDPYSIGYSGHGYDVPLNQKVFMASFDAIKKMAKEGPCVFVGRCADYALSDMDSVLNVFIHAPIEYRIQNIMKRMDLSHSKAETLVVRKDKQRASYYNYYTTKKWSDTNSYDVTINSAMFGVEKTVDIILDIYNRM
ncbi:MAG: AAA family ATPase [Lachnospiraceae bacterium]